VFARQKFHLVLAFTSMMVLSIVPGWAGQPRNGEPPLLVAISKLPEVKTQQKLDKALYHWESYNVDLQAMERQVRRTGRLKLRAGGRDFDLALELNDLRGPGFKRVLYTDHGPVVEKPTPVATYKGHVAGDPESVVRLFIRPDLFEGYIRTADEWIFIDPLLKYEKGADPSAVVLFRDSDVRAEAATACGSGALAHHADDLGIEPQEKALIASPTLGRADVATEADVEYYGIYGASTNNHIESVLNGVDGIYRGDLALTLRIVYESVWTAETDPYSSTDPSTLLSQFANYWNANRAGVARDLAHLFTGKALQTYIGIAYVGVVCSSPTLAYGLSANYSPEVKLAAHEIGHNFNAQHDDQVTPPAAPCNGSGPIMCSVLWSNSPYFFSDRSKTDITSFVNNNGACLDRLSLTSYTVLTTQLPDTDLAAQPGYEAGNQIGSSQDGYITALRFYKSPNETGTHTGRLWDNSGTLLASVQFTNETGSGWQEQYLPFRVKITAGSRYWVTYNANTSQQKTGCGLGTPITNGPLTAYAGAYSGAGGSGTFPTNPSCSNFFADVYFTP